MKRKIKLVGLVLAAVAALSTAASSAQAGSLHTGAQPAVLTGASAFPESIFSLALKSGTVLKSKCETSTFEGTVQGQAGLTDVTLTPTYGNCVMFNLPVGLRMNGCKFTVTGAGQPAFTNQVDIVGCTAGKKIEFEPDSLGSCKVTIGEQNNLSHIVFENKSGPPKDLRGMITLTGMVSTQDAGCPEPGVTAANFSFEGDTTVRAFKDTGSKQVTLHNHQYLQSTEGEQVDLFST